MKIQINPVLSHWNARNSYDSKALIRRRRLALEGSRLISGSLKFSWKTVYHYNTVFTGQV